DFIVSRITGPFHAPVYKLPYKFLASFVVDHDHGDMAKNASRQADQEHRLGRHLFEADEEPPGPMLDIRRQFVLDQGKPEPWVLLKRTRKQALDFRYAEGCWVRDAVDHTG